MDPISCLVMQRAFDIYQKRHTGPVLADWMQSPVEPKQASPVTSVSRPAKEVQGHQAVSGQTRTPTESVAPPTGLPHQTHGQLQSQTAQMLFSAAASTASRMHSQEVPTQPVVKLSPGKVYTWRHPSQQGLPDEGPPSHPIIKMSPGSVHVTSFHQSQQGLHSQETLAQARLQAAHSSQAALPVQAGASAAVAHAEQQIPPLTEIAHKAQTALLASMQQPAVSEACPVQPIQQQQHSVQAHKSQQTGQGTPREQSAHAPQQEAQPLQRPQASGQDAGSAAPGLHPQQEQQRSHAQANGHNEGLLAGARRGSWSSTEGDDDFANWEQHILASAVPEPSGADAEQQNAGNNGLRAASNPPQAKQRDVCQGLEQEACILSR